MFRSKIPIQFDEIWIKLNQIIKNTHTPREISKFDEGTDFGTKWIRIYGEFHCKLRFLRAWHLYLAIWHHTRIKSLFFTPNGVFPWKNSWDTRFLYLHQICNFNLFTVHAISFNLRLKMIKITWKFIENSN